MQALYQAEIAGGDIDAAIANVAETEKFIPATRDFAAQLAKQAWQSKAAIDQIISQFAIDWPLERIGKVDRAILCLAIEELRLKETPDSVIINEAVELAKKYAGADAAKFINGILGAYVRQSG